MRLLLTAALYGASIGAFYGPRRIAQNLVKLPLLIVVTALVCALACFFCARLLLPRIRFVEVQALMWALYHDACLLLASLATINLFLTLALTAPTSPQALNDYPLFLGLNITFIAICGALALIKQAWSLLLRHPAGRLTHLAVLAAWLGLSLIVGGQWSWYLRPFFGVPRVEEAPFCEGLRPDFRGAESFYEAVYDLITEPPDSASTTQAYSPQHK